MNLSSLQLKETSGLSFEQLPHLRTLQTRQTGEWSATMRGTKSDIAVRVCAYRKTDEQKRESEPKLQKEAKKKQQQL